MTLKKLKPFTIAAVAAGWCVVGANPAFAELIFFSPSRSMSVLGHRVDGDTIIVQLRGGGEMTFDRQLITRIAPDEVPYPNPDSPESRASTGSGRPELVEGRLPNSGSRSASEPQQYNAIIERASAQQGIDAAIVKAVIRVESGYQPGARSPKGAIGLMQLMPETARHYAVRNPYDPGANIEAGTKHLSMLLRQFELPLALAAYNAGEAAVRRFGGVPPYAETRAYVARILSLLKPSL